MISEREIIYRKKQSYAAIKIHVTRDEIPKLLPPLISELFNWLEKNKVEPSGPPFFCYYKMEGEKMLVKVGTPVDSDIPRDDRVEDGFFPEGKYAVVNYKGNYSNLYTVNSEFEKWAAKKGIEFCGPRTEFYPAAPDADPDKSETIIINQIAEN